jgi:hypothetical protein
MRFVRSSVFANLSEEFRRYVLSAPKGSHPPAASQIWKETFLCGLGERRRSSGVSSCKRGDISQKHRLRNQSVVAPIRSVATIGARACHLVVDRLCFARYLEDRSTERQRRCCGKYCSYLLRLQAIFRNPYSPLLFWYRSQKYGLGPIMKDLGVKLQDELPSGSFVLSNVFSIPGWKPSGSSPEGTHIYAVPQCWQTSKEMARKQRQDEVNLVQSRVDSE